jgi:hypothetical protein
VKNLIGKQQASRKGAKPQSPAKQTNDFFLALLCALASLREAVNFFTASEALPTERTENTERRLDDSSWLYRANEHDTFPPATILLNLCLLDWGFTGEVKAGLGYYLSTS